MTLNEAKKKIKLFAKRQATRLKVLFIVEFLKDFSRRGEQQNRAGFQNQ